MQRIPMPQAPRKLVPTLSDDQILSLLQTFDQKTAVGYRDYCIVLFLLDTGVRLGELTALRMADLDLKHLRAKIVGKGTRERIVPLGATLCRALFRYVERWQPQAARPVDDYVFLT
jgi:site-specific recombinase XerD